MLCKPHRRRSRPKTYKTNPYIDRLARPRLGLITAKYRNPSDTALCRPAGCCCEPRCRCMERHRRVSCRLVELAQPLDRNVTCKYRPARTYQRNRYRDCPCPPPYNEACWTRTTQLALPYVRNLVDTRRRFRRCCYDERRAKFMEKRIQASMMSVYSKLAGFRKPEKR